METLATRYNVTTKAIIKQYKIERQNHNASKSLELVKFWLETFELLEMLKYFE